MKYIKPLIFLLFIFSSLIAKANTPNVFDNDQATNGNVFNSSSSPEPPPPSDDGGGTTGTGSPEPVVIDRHLFLLALTGVIIIVFSKIKLFGIRIGNKEKASQFLPMADNSTAFKNQNF